MNDVHKHLKISKYPPTSTRERALPHTLAKSPYTYQKPTSPTCRGAPSQGRRCRETEATGWPVSPPPLAPTAFPLPQLYPINPAFESFLSPKTITGLEFPNHQPPVQPRLLATPSLVSLHPLSPHRIGSALPPGAAFFRKPPLTLRSAPVPVACMNLSLSRSARPSPFPPATGTSVRFLQWAQLVLKIYW